MNTVDIKLYSLHGNRIANLKAMVAFGLIHNALHLAWLLVGG